MKYWDRKIICEQLDKKLQPLRTLGELGIPPQGWIKSIREALNISSRQLGKKAGIDQSRISRLENAEKNGNLKLSSLQKIAQALNMKFVYGFVSKNTLEQLLREQALKIARKRLKRLNDTMLLEKQTLSSSDQEKALNNMIDRILIEQPKDFWDEK
ncbi:MAG: mobile mystery protein A [Candidatus Omnitrophica bacterium]|nr:mobile mystery protein A [Candidatus Omnitrophota bacterium]